MEERVGMEGRVGMEDNTNILQRSIDQSRIDELEERIKANIDGLKRDVEKRGTALREVLDGLLYAQTIVMMSKEGTHECLFDLQRSITRINTILGEDDG